MNVWFPQSDKLAHDELVKNLKPYGYEPTPYAPGLWVNKKQKITFTFVVDDFGIKHSSLHNLNHLIEALMDKQTITINHSSSMHIGVTLKWNYILREVNCSMPAYHPSILKRFQHLTPTTPQHIPHPAPNITCGKSV